MQKLKCPECPDFSKTEQEWNDNHTNPYHNEEEGKNEKKYICQACNSQSNMEDLIPE